MLGALEGGGALFWPQLYAAAGGGDEQVVLAAVWDLVWDGLVTNDTLAPARALVSGGRARSSSRRPGRGLGRLGPPSATGRWSLTAPLFTAAPPATERAVALATQLLQRHGVLTRGALSAEDVEGGWAAVYGTLKAMEEAGRVRRGYFVEGLGGAQFALPGAIDRLRARAPDPPETYVLACTDPASPFGAALAWPERSRAAGHTPRRVAGAHVVVRDGQPVLYLEKGARSVLTFTDDAAALGEAAEALAGLVAGKRLRSVRIQRIDGELPLDQPLLAALRAAGFADAPDGLVRR